MPQKTSFKSFLLKRFLLTLGLALIISITITSAIIFVIISQQYNQNINEVTKATQKNINKFLATGWRPQNLNAISRTLNTQYPLDKYYFIKSQQFDRKERESLTPQLTATLDKIETTHQAFTEKNLLHSRVTGGFPVIFEARCLSCHPTLKVGTYAGTVLFSRPVSSVLLSWGSLTIFFILFIILFSLLGTVIFLSGMQQKVVHPLTNLSERIRAIRLDDNKLEWQRKQLDIEEIDDIDGLISENILRLKSINEKLDSLMVTEHQSGFFHQDRFQEALKFEIYRSDRYKKVFSILIIKLQQIESLDTQIELSLGEKISIFSDLIHQTTRDSDM